MQPFGAIRGASGRLLQLFTLLLLTLQNTALVLVTKFSYREGTMPYAVSTVIMFSEAVKFVFSCFMVVVCDGHAALKEALRDTATSALRLSLPSVLYVIQNNLLFEGVRTLSPTAYTACSQSKILTSAFFGVMLLKLRITRKQSVALCGLVIGMIMVQNGDRANVRKEYIRSDSPLYGVVVVFLASCTSGFAGTYLEKMYKEAHVGGIKPSIWFRNAQLSCFSLPIAGFTAYWRDSKTIFSEGVFAGYNGTVITIIALQAIGGLVVAAVMRYASNLLKCFAVSLSICICAVATTCVFGDGQLAIGAQQVVGVMLVICSTFVFMAKKTL